MKPTIFLSHFTHEAKVANALKRFIEDSFAHAVDVFVSANPLSLRPGDPWEKTIRRALRESKVVLSLLSLDSLQRPWIYFESGAAWFNHATLIPLLHRGLAIAALPQQFQSLQAIYLHKPDDISRLMARIQDIHKLRRNIPHAADTDFAKELNELAQQIDTSMQQHENLPTVSFTLYGKTHAQERANRAEAGSGIVSNFRKPSLAQVFSALLKTGQAYTNIISVDEYWVRSLVESARLEPLSDQVARKHILKELLQFPSREGECWTLPHFLDFSYYSVRRNESGRLVECLHALVQADGNAYPDALHHLKQVAGVNHLLAYDFRTPDTVSSVIAEFIDSVGEGLNSLASARDVVSPRNVRALELLRDLVGPRSKDDFVWGKPLNLDTECHHAAFLRHWHSMASDEAEARGTHSPVFDNPIKAHSEDGIWEC